jgi:hypothetical protein
LFLVEGELSDENARKLAQRRAASADSRVPIADAAKIPRKFSIQRRRQPISLNGHCRTSLTRRGEGADFLAQRQRPTGKVFGSAGKGPAVVTFYRGGWCYCNLQLRDYQKHLSEMQALGASLIAITPETPDKSLSTVEKNNLQFEVWPMRGNVAHNLVSFAVVDVLRPIYKNIGRPAHSTAMSRGITHSRHIRHCKDGTVKLAFVDSDYTSVRNCGDLGQFGELPR